MFMLRCFSSSFPFFVDSVLILFPILNYYKQSKKEKNRNKPKIKTTVRKSWHWISEYGKLSSKVILIWHYVKIIHSFLERATFRIFGCCQMIVIHAMWCMFALPSLVWFSRQWFFYVIKRSRIQTNDYIVHSFNLLTSDIIWTNLIFLRIDSL